MKIMEPYAEIIGTVSGDDVLKITEMAARTCYQSGDMAGEGTAEKLVRACIRRGHESVLEHACITARIVTDRATQNQIVRHRLCAYSVESTRYCNYMRGKFGGEITVIEPLGLTPEARMHWLRACEMAETQYRNMLDDGKPPEEARAVLPLCLKTEMVMTANVRQWRHIFRLRCGKAAAPETRRIMTRLLDAFKERFPVVFDDIVEGMDEA